MNRSRRRRVQRRLERRPISGDELLAPQPQARVLRQPEVERPRHAERPLGMAGPADRFGQAVELGGHGRSGPRPGAPVVDVRRRGEEVALLRVAARVCDDQVLEAVVGVARPRDEVVHVRRLAGAAREALRAVEAPSLLELDDRPAHALERHARPKRKRSSWYSSRRFSVATLTAHWWWISGRRRWFSRTSASPTPARRKMRLSTGPPSPRW